MPQDPASETILEYAGTPEDKGVAEPDEATARREEKIVGKLRGLYDESAAAHRPERVASQEYYRWWAGDHYHGSSKADWQAKSCPNLIFATIETIIPIITDGMPQWDAVPRNPEAEKNSDIADAILSNVWDENNSHLQLAKAVRMLQLDGTYYWWDYFDPEADGGAGRIVHRLVGKINLLPDPSAEDFDDANYVHYAENVSLGYIRRMWPEKGKRVRAVIIDPLLKQERDPVNAGGGASLDDPQFMLSQGATGSDGYSSTRNEELSPGSESDYMDDLSARKQVTLVHSYVRMQKGIQCYVWAGNVLLEEYENQLNGTRMGDIFPFAKTVNYHKPGAWHGGSEIEWLINPQQMVNDALNHVLDNAKLTGNPVLAYSSQSGFVPESYAAGPGVAIEVNGDPNSMIRWLEIPRLDPKMFDIVNFGQSIIKVVSGAQDAITGKRPPGVIAASAIATLQESIQIRLREKFRMVAAGLAISGRNVWELARKFYDLPRILRITGKDGKPDFITMNMAVPGPDGQPVQTNTLADADYDIKIELGAGMPASKTQKANLALQARQIQAIDNEAFLEAVEFPGREDILRRQKEQQAAQMQAQQAAMAQGGGGGGQAAQVPAAVSEMARLVQEGFAPATDGEAPVNG